MKIAHIIELASAMNSKGTKKISLRWDDFADRLFVREESSGRDYGIQDSRLDDVIDMIENPKGGKIDKATIDLLVQEIERLRYEVESLKKSDYRLVLGIKKKEPAPLSDYDKLIAYYFFLYNNDLGQGQGKLWPGMRYMPKGWVELRWKNTVEYWRERGYDI